MAPGMCFSCRMIPPHHTHTHTHQVESPEVVQTKLREIWNRLYFPESQQMDMTIKYSNPRIMSQLGKVGSSNSQLSNVLCGVT